MILGETDLRPSHTKHLVVSSNTQKLCFLSTFVLGRAMMARQPQMLQTSAVETGQMSSVETGQMSGVETGQMSAVETRVTRWMSSAEKRQI